MLRRVAGIVLVVLGAVAVTLGALSATAWRTSDVVTARTQPADVPFVVVEPGVGSIVNRLVDVTITAADPDQTITLIEGRDVDVDAWLAEIEVQRVTGLTDWETLTTTVGATTAQAPEATESPAEGEATEAPAEGEATEAPAEGEATETPAEGEATTAEIPDPVGNDMWLSTEQATGEISYTWTVPDDRTELLIVRGSADGPAPSVAFTWKREVATPYLLPLAASGVAGIVVGFGLILSSTKKNREALAAADEAAKDEESETEEPKAEEPKGDQPADTPSSAESPADGEGSGSGVAAAKATVGAAGDDPGPATAETKILTRRQLRALREQDRVEEIAGLTGEIEAASAIPPATDAPGSYPAWLRSEQTEESTADAAADLPTSSADAWRRRWGVTAQRNPVRDGADRSENDGAAAPHDEGERPADGTAVRDGEEDES